MQYHGKGECKIEERCDAEANQNVNDICTERSDAECLDAAVSFALYTQRCSNMYCKYYLGIAFVLTVFLHCGPF